MLLPPNTPELELPEYLLRLDSRVRVFGVNSILRRFVRANFTSTRTLSTELRMNPHTLSGYLYSGSVPLSLLITFSEKYGLYVDILGEKTIYFGGKRNIIALPRYLSPRLAYFVGYLQGDGCLESNCRRISFTDESLGHMQFMKELGFNLFNVPASIQAKRSVHSLKDAYVLELGSIAVHSFLAEIFSLPIGVKNNMRIPPIILLNKEILRWYLRGLFDADGTLPKNPYRCKQLFIDIALKDLSIIVDIRAALGRFGLKTLAPYPRTAKSSNSDTICTTWELRIRRKDEIKKFLREVGFTHFDKGARGMVLSTYLDL